MDGTLNILTYGGIAVISALLVIFEIRDGQISNGHTWSNNDYEYYTADGNILRIRHIFGTLYKCYVFGDCPIAISRDRLGSYFTIRAHSASEAEHLVDRIYERESVEN